MTQVYCEMINLARAQARRDLMAPMLRAAGIGAEIHPGYDYNQDPRSELERLTRDFGPWGLFKQRDRAVTVSHARVWQRFLETEAPYCLVLEDDVFVSPELGLWLEDLSWWPADTGIVKIERWRSRTLKILMLSGTEHLGRSVRRLLSRHTGAAGYFLTREAAQALLDQAPFRLTVDQLLFNLNASAAARRLGVAQITPALVVQGNEPPDTPDPRISRGRPAGKTLFRQKLLRAYYELAYPLSTLIAFLRGKATLETVPYAEETLNPQTKSVSA